MTTETEHYEAWVCTDCYYAHHGLDDDGTETPDSEILGLIDPSADVTDNTCSNHDGTDEVSCTQCSQTGYENGITEFSWSRCDGCGSHLGGSRYRLAVWPTCTTTTTTNEEKLTMYTTQEIQTAAQQAGAGTGHAAATWVVDGNTTEEQARSILSAIEDCEYDFPAPLSGEYAGESIPEIVQDSGLIYEDLFTDDMADRNDLDTFLDAYEAEFLRAYEDEVTRSASAILTDPDA